MTTDSYTTRLMDMLRHRGRNTATLHVESPGRHCCPIAYCEWRTPVLDDTAALDAIARHLDRAHPSPTRGGGVRILESDIADSVAVNSSFSRSEN